ncbi:uncharacterized protein LOC123877999 [Maniola jurtina]|uniref:uncharacterized protein LOC123877999 n=1 Tax=Maniola jurtina TaxID=191418 RepID=UPI001E68FAEF|nr:uncharacterized protein LOC123877999 [Maniola jurtina]
MKMLALMLVSIALAEGGGSGPYSPRGWRPDGPSFLLPSEIVEASPTPAVESSLPGSEASGSEFLREYGPPKVQDISQNLLNQGLPDVAMEQLFELSAHSAGSSQVVAEKVVEVSEVQPEAVSAELPSAAAVDDYPPISAELPILDFVVKATTTIPNIEPATEVSSQSNQQESNVQSNQQSSQASSQYVSELTNQQNSETQSTEFETQQDSQESATVQTNQQESAQALESQQESSTVSALEKVTASVDSVGNTEVLLVNIPAIYDQNVPELQNIPDIIAGLEKEVLTEQAAAKQAGSEVPEGFLEYGPPAFAEYGPPKREPSGNLRAIDTNETRRRRFSPRIRFGKK